MDALSLSGSSDFALVIEGRTWSAAELRASVRRVQGVLERSGVEPGAVVAFVARVDEPSLVLTLALLDAGVACLPLHPRGAPLEHAELIRRAGALKLEPLELEPGTEAEPQWLRWVRARGHHPEAIAALLATSGTSGEPKLVRLSRRAFVASARASAEHLGFEPNDRWLLCLPFAHVGGLSILTRCLVSGRSVVAHSGFEPELILERIESQAVTLLSVVPAMLGPLLSADSRGVLARLRMLLVGGSACSEELRREAGARGIRLSTTYGLTEACSQVTTQRAALTHDPTTLDSGCPLPGVEVRIVGGVIELRGPVLMSGYLGEPELPRGSFFTTRDLGELDAAGRLIVSGRVDDVVITGGEKVHPAQVEAVLSAVPGVSAALVFGASEPRFGQSVAALLVLDRGSDAAVVLARARESVAAALAAHARPRSVACVEALPLNALGKPDRRRARLEHGNSLEPWPARPPG